MSSETSGGNGLYGFVLPLTAEAIHDILHGRNIYAKFSADQATDLKANHRVYFYGSDNPGKLQGEARVSSIRFQRLAEVMLYGERLFLPPEQFAKYVAGSSAENQDMMMVLELGEPTQYMKPVKCPFLVPPDGKYVTKELYKEILRANR